jgi:hypothetical protein
MGGRFTGPALVSLQEDIQEGRRTAPWALVDGMVTFNTKLYVPPSSTLLHDLVADIHNDKHEGIQRTLHHDFHAPNLRSTVLDFIRGCLTCQRYKTEHLLPGGLLLPLPMPPMVWADVALNFIEGLPKVGCRSVILTVVDRFSKYRHFIPLGHPYTNETVTKVFLAEIVHLHGIPQSIVSDCDPAFTLTFWKELLTLSGVKLHMTICSTSKQMDKPKLPTR